MTTPIDFRSDTVTVPTPAMREAMASAPVGDDVFGDDPTVNQLEAEASALLGKDSGLFVASGTMGNLTALLTHCGRGDEIIVGREAHIVRYELGGAAAYGGIQPFMLDVNSDGTMNLDGIRAAFRPHSYLMPSTRLICLENTHGGVGGVPVSADYVAQVAAIARERGVPLHVDGARLFNAAAALNTSAKTLAEGADSVMFCLSKGLCAPVGSLLVGSNDFIARARKIRKSLGGGMRQVGVLAAAGLIAIREMTLRLHEDHTNARLLADGLATLPGIEIDLNTVKTNMVFFRLRDDISLTPADLMARLKAEHNILMLGADARTVRAVTHYYVTRDDVRHTLDAIRTLLAVSATAA